MVTPPAITIQYPVFDTADPGRDAAFWARLLNGVVTRTDDDWHTISYGDGDELAFQLDPEHTPPNWPEGDQQVHLDFLVQRGDIAAAHAHALDIGATLATPENVPSGEPITGGFIAYLDPSGHPFCLCW